MDAKERAIRTAWSFAAGFALCLLMTRLFVTNDATYQTWLAALCVPIGIGRSMRVI